MGLLPALVSSSEGWKKNGQKPETRRTGSEVRKARVEAVYSYKESAKFNPQRRHMGTHYSDIQCVTSQLDA